MTAAFDTAGNVRRLHAKRKTKMRVTRASALMEQCRTRFREHMHGSTPAMMDQIDDALFDLADKADSGQSQRVYFEAMRSVRLRREDIEARFASELDAAVAQRLAPGAGSGAPQAKVALALVEEDDLEETVAVKNLAGKIRNLCHEDLFALDRRIALLLGEPELEGEANPLGPEVLCNAARAAVAVIEEDLEIRLLVLKLFDRHLTRAAQQFYPAVNAWLVEQGVLPDVSAGLVGRPGGAGRAPSRPERAPGAGAQPAAAADTGNPASAGTPAACGTVAGEFAGVGGSAPWGGAPAAGTPRGEQVLGVLDQIMRVGGAQGIDLADEGPQRERFIGSLTDMQRGAALVGGNVVRELKASASASGISHTDGLMIDVVAMMFDFVLEDGNIADAMRALIGRLQIPVLKVAILDKSFFARRTHPARSLINTLAAYGARMGTDMSAHEPVFEQVRALVERILDEFDSELDVFSAALEELEAIVAADDEAVERSAWTSARVAEQRERLAQARRHAEQEVEARLAGTPAPEPVALFLRAHWRHLLGERLFRDGDDGEGWRSGLQAMDRLLWSTAPKRETVTRDRLLSLLPLLLSQLKDGMRELGLAPEARDTFLRTLSALHVCALKGVDPAGGAEVCTPASASQPLPGTASEDPAPLPGARASRLLREAIERANTLVWETAEERPQCQGMGATLVAIKLEGDHLACAHLGDSRLYRLRDGLLEQLTRDHTYRQEVLDKGLASAAEAAGIASNFITRAVGGDADVQVETNVHAVRAGDLFLACSDGLSDMVDDARICELLLDGSHHDLDALAGALIAAANESGGRDNVSVGLLRVDESLPPGAGGEPRDYGAFVRAAVATDPGRRRAHNEDAIDCDLPRGVLVLADGMGGHNAGEVASAMTVRVVLDALRTAPRPGDAASGAREAGAAVAAFDFATMDAVFWGEADDAGLPENAALHAAVAAEVESITLCADDLDACFDIDADDGGALCAGDAANDPLLERVLRLGRGSWVEFGAVPGRGVRARLSWVAPGRARYLFTDRFGAKVSESTPHGLAVELRRGRLRVLDTVPLFERAMGNITHRLRPVGATH